MQPQVVTILWSMLLLAFDLVNSAQVPDKYELSKDADPVEEVTVKCQPDSILMTISLKKLDIGDSSLEQRTQVFSGIIYPYGLGKNSSCMKEVKYRQGQILYSVPLQGCNTMSFDYDDGTVEFFNNIVVQPHLNIVTGGGRGYDIRCKYSRKELTSNHMHSTGNSVNAARRVQGGDYDDLSDEVSDSSLPAVTMKIYKGDPREKKIASTVKIGEVLTLIVDMEKQNKYNLLISECNVKDGLGWAEQTLIADDGCPLDGEIMGMFKYNSDKTKAQVTFPAHKFPYTSSVYYSCSVKMCDKATKQCISCSDRPKRQKRQEESQEGQPATVEVFQGLYVNEANDLSDTDEVTSVKNEDEICINQRKFAIGICIAGVILMILAVIAIAVILARRRRPKTSSRTGSSLYSGPYTNTGYSHTS